MLDFSNIVHKNGERSPVYARVLDVDNARETIQNNEILGIVQPHASNKGAIAMAAVSFANPIAGYDPHVDRERDRVTTDLLFIGTGLAYADVDRPNASKVEQCDRGRS